MFMTEENLTTGNTFDRLIKFAMPFLLSCFIQTLYGLVDMYVVGLYNGSDTTAAVAVGSQVMHMLTVMIAGLTMGVTVEIGRAVGAQDREEGNRVTGTAITCFAVLSLVITAILLLSSRYVTNIMRTPSEAVAETNRYLIVCFGGIPLIVAYNLISSIYRGRGDSKRPMIFVASACLVNIALDFLFVGYLHMGASGAALATVIGQGTSVVLAVKHMICSGFLPPRGSLSPDRNILRRMTAVGLPIALQDGTIQIAFIIITVIANMRGLVIASAVGVVEKIICFMFLVPSAFMSAISAITAQNMGAGKPERARQTLRLGIAITVSWGVFCLILSQIIPDEMVCLFRSEPDIVTAGSSYLRAYSADCIFAAVHFCFSGYFCGNHQSSLSFLHNILSVALIRIPGAYLSSVYYPATLFPMGLAAPLGSLFSAVFCICAYAITMRRCRYGEASREWREKQ